MGKCAPFGGTFCCLCCSKLFFLLQNDFFWNFLLCSNFFVTERFAQNCDVLHTNQNPGGYALCGTGTPQWLVKRSLGTFVPVLPAAMLRCALLPTHPGTPLSGKAHRSLRRSHFLFTCFAYYCLTFAFCVCFACTCAIVSGAPLPFFFLSDTKCARRTQLLLNNLNMLLPFDIISWRWHYILWPPQNLSHPNACQIPSWEIVT